MYREDAEIYEDLAYHDIDLFRERFDLTSRRMLKADSNGISESVVAE